LAFLYVIYGDLIRTSTHLVLISRTRYSAIFRSVITIVEITVADGSVFETGVGVTLVGAELRASLECQGLGVYVTGTRHDTLVGVAGRASSGHVTLSLSLRVLHGRSGVTGGALDHGTAVPNFSTLGGAIYFSIGVAGGRVGEETWVVSSGVEHTVEDSSY